MSKLLKCLECDTLFFEEDARVVDERDEPSYIVCPSCGCSELEDTVTCNTCGEDVAVSELEEGTDDCQSCWVESEGTG